MRSSGRSRHWKLERSIVAAPKTKSEMLCDKIICLYLLTCTHTIIRTHICIHPYIHTCVNINTHTHTHTYQHKLTYTYANIHTHIGRGIITGDIRRGLSTVAKNTKVRSLNRELHSLNNDPTIFVFCATIDTCIDTQVTVFHYPIY